MAKPKIGFVVQRCGREVNGGAEALCLAVAGLMKDLWEVEVITTCALHYMTWDNDYPAGLSDVEVVPVRRFSVDRPRDVTRFNRLSDRVRSSMPDVNPAECENWMRAQGPMSTSLFNYLEQTNAGYDAYFFFTYLYATSYFGLQFVHDKAILVPTAHDEWPIHLPIWDQWFGLPRMFVFNTPEEEQFLRTRFPSKKLEGKVIGVGVNVPASCSAVRFRKRYRLEGEYILYLGRIDESKGCGQLFDYFLRYKNNVRDNLKLVLIGRAVMDIPSHPSIIALGFLDHQTKYDALAGCSFLINPSPYESLSMVLLEAWSLNKPVLVSAKSDVLVGQCKRSNGGLWYGNYEEFEACVNYLMANEGHVAYSASRFVVENYTWDAIRMKYSQLLDQFCRQR
jgi:glycosyltransferase involved in cell wall biosynthesis